MQRIILIIVLTLAIPGYGQTSQPAPLELAVSGQRRVLVQLAEILREQRVSLSDGAMRVALAALLEDEKKQAEGIRGLGQRTLGKGADELSDHDVKDRNQLAENQQIYADRFRRLFRTLEMRTATEPDSVFSKLLAAAEDNELQNEMDAAAKYLNDNQLGNAIKAVNRVIAILTEMVGTLGGETDKTGEDEGAATEGAFAVPSLWAKAPDQRLSQFGWTGDQIDMLGAILKSVKMLEALVERQRKVAEAVKVRSKTEKTADDLAKEEWEIRYYALQIAEQIAILDPQIDSMIRKGTGAIEQGIEGMEKGPLSNSVAPAAEAAKHLQSAAERLRAMWKDILERIKQYAMATEPLIGSGMGIPHGASPEATAQRQKMALMMLRATRALTDAMNRQVELLDKTETSGEKDLPPLIEPQKAIGQFITDEVIPFNVPGSQLPRAVRSNLSAAPADDLLKDAIGRIGRATEAMGLKDHSDTLKRQQQALELMSDAMAVMIDILQRLLGQKAPQGLAVQTAGPGAGMALDPAGTDTKASGWFFTLPSEQRERVRQGFRGTFPQRYDRAIKLYYEAIAEKDSRD